MTAPDTGRGRRAGRRLLVTGALVGALGFPALLGHAPEADAHPLGNATVNHYDGLELFPDHVADTAVIDTAEIPTLQRTPLIDSNGDGVISTAEASAYAAAQCRDLAATVGATVDSGRVGMTVATASYVQLPGAAGLKVGRLECHLTGTADLSRPTTLAFDDSYDSAGIGGWHEITATGDGVALQRSPVPAASITDQLRHYPNDLLSSPLDVRSTQITTVPGAGASTYTPLNAVPGADAVLRVLNALSNRFNDLVGTQNMSVGVGLLALGLSILLGAGHAFLPGHGKTIMAAYLVGKRGRLRDVVTVGATVTITHTFGVLALGVLLSASAALAPTAVEQVLAVISGLIVAGVGVGLLVSALRRRHSHPGAVVATPTPRADIPAAAVGAQHPHPHAAPETTGLGRAPVLEADPEPTHGHGHGHGGHGHGKGFGRGGLIGLGVAGGLVPSPSALLVLLAAIALGRTALGIGLVLGYGLGMALALTLAGLLLVKLQNRINGLLQQRHIARLGAVVTYLPALTALLVILVGVGLTLRALSGSV